MGFIKERVDYLKENPESYWFKSKPYGYGWTPARLAGWVTLVVYLVSILGVAIYTEIKGTTEAQIERLFLFIVVATVLLIIICWRTGEPLKWRWGKKKDKKRPE